MASRRYAAAFQQGSTTLTRGMAGGERVACAIPMPAPRLVFIVGCPRSGTTWLREMLARHPQVCAAGMETAVFTLYLARLDAAWKGEKRRAPPDTGYGIHSVLDEAGFDRLLRDFADRILETAIPVRPGCRVRLEKTPDHAKQAPLILRLYPEAAFLHVIRDPREVFCSFRGARAWTQAFPDNPVVAARTWTEFVSRALEIRPLTPRYAEVRYERLLSHGEEELARLFQWMELDTEPGLPSQILADCRFDRMRADHPNQAFFRRGAADGWKQELSSGELRRLEHVAGPLMESLGYRRATKASAIGPLRFALRRGLERIHAALDPRFRGVIHRL